MGATQLLNEFWDDERAGVEAAVSQFNLGVEALLKIFGPKSVARKPGSRSFNRAIFDSLIFYAANEECRDLMLRNRDDVPEPLSPATLAEK